ncbi:MAG: hypothetical protein ACRDA4_06760 [Filifactoraceae bacterium]
MHIFDLKKLDNGQEVPKIIYRPFKIHNNNAYFEKIVIAKDHEWTDGIVEYDLNSHMLTRIDEGPHTEEPMMFDVEVPFTYEDIQVLQKMKSIYYSSTTELDSTIYIKFYEIDLVASVQRLIMSFSYKKDQVLYRGMEILTNGYIIFRISNSIEDDDSGFKDRIYLIDVSERTYYEIHDEVLRLTFGNKYVIDQTNPTLIVEEYYISESEQFELLTLKDVELAFDLPDNIDENYIHKNAIHQIPFKTFLKLVKSDEPIKYSIVDDIYLEGSIRIIGKTDKNIYYRKRIYDHILKDSKDFLARQMMGKELLMKINTNTHKVQVVGPYEYHTEYAFSSNKLYAVLNSDLDIRLENVDTKKIEIIYMKRTNLFAKERVLAVIDSKNIILKTRYLDSLKDDSTLIIHDVENHDDLSFSEDIFVIGDYLFTQ